MEITHIEHIGIAVDNLEESIRYYEDVLGLKCYGKMLKKIIHHYQKPDMNLIQWI